MLRFLVLATSVLATPPVCVTSWKKSFQVQGDEGTSIGKYTLAGLGLSGAKTGPPNGLIAGEGVFTSSVFACVHCMNELVGTKSCPIVSGSSCHALNVAQDFAKKTVENVEGGELGTKEIDGTNNEQWTYTINSNGGGVPEGSVACGPVLVKAADPKATTMTVDKACANSPFCADKTAFELCCEGLEPEDTLCADGKHCCGEVNAVTIGVSAASSAQKCQEQAEAPKAKAAAAADSECDRSEDRMPTARCEMILESDHHHPEHGLDHNLCNDPPSVSNFREHCERTCCRREQQQ